MLTNKKLKYWYRRYNRVYFKNRLPDISVRFANLKRDLGFTHYEGCEPVYIEINREYRSSRAVTLTTLLHEMVHVCLPYRVIGHGPRFDREMLKLARLGAFHGLW